MPVLLLYAERTSHRGHEGTPIWHDHTVRNKGQNFKDFIQHFTMESGLKDIISWPACLHKELILIIYLNEMVCKEMLFTLIHLTVLITEKSV